MKPTDVLIAIPERILAGSGGLQMTKTMSVSCWYVGTSGSHQDGSGKMNFVNQTKYCLV